ncbi:efflux RND transporter periplasmic adaptor subunit [Fundidesulfovibrio terrae]|uniref:efflux RND transporter periplasmic adaptor subunit n=1 Tax=Fundidesulfovibrio terrae TaxID=2922866 RepID=UPI001FB027F2|nr:efflux RND transporter periplasmic adaptor subunit [Fundidesulfovibrio terrae]
MNQDLGKLRIDRQASASAQGRRRVGKWIWAAGAALALAAVAALMPHTREVETVQAVMVYPTRAFTQVNATGYVVADRKAAVAAKVTSTLVWLGVEEGSRVKAGQLLARLENLDVAAALDKARADLAAAEFNVDVAKAELADARLNHDRLEQLVKKDLVARSDYDAAVARLHKAEGAHGNAVRQVASARAQVEAAKAQAGYTEIRAPFDAVVLTKSADVGDIVTPIGASTTSKASVVTIADMNSLQVEADVSESNVAKIRQGQPVEIMLDAFGEERFPGYVHMIVPTADKTKATVLVKVRFDALDPRVLPQMSAKVAFLERAPTPDERAPRLAVPVKAVIDAGGGKAVFRSEGGVAALTPVKVGNTLGDMLEIVEGLLAGDRVVLSPPAALKDGDKIAAAGK